MFNEESAIKKVHGNSDGHCTAAESRCVLELILPAARGTAVFGFFILSIRGIEAMIGNYQIRKAAGSLIKEL